MPQMILYAGPGCSSVGGGAFTELGPFYPRGDGRGLRINKKSWNKGFVVLSTQVKSFEPLQKL